MMRFDRTKLKSAATALIRIGLFAIVFVVLQALVASLAIGTLAAAVVAGLLLLRFAEHRPPGDLGFRLNRRAAPQLVVGGLIGVAGLLIACMLLVLMGVLQFDAQAGTVGSWLTGEANMLLWLLAPAAAEEALFRGYPFQKLVEGFGAPVATVIASFGFAIAHAQNPAVSGFALANIFAAGIMLSVAFLATRSLWFATGVHLGWNWSMAALLDLPVSGLELFDAPFYQPVDRGPAWLTGGAFGPEGGVAGLIGLLLVLGGVIWMTRKMQWLKSTK